MRSLFQDVLDRSMILPAPILFWSDALIVFRHVCEFSTYSLINEVEISFEQNYGAKFVYSKAIRFLQQGTVYALSPSMIGVPRP